MTIIGKSKAAFAMICDAVSSQSNIYPTIKILNNLDLPDDFSYRGLEVSETKVADDYCYVLGAMMPETKRKLVELFNLPYQTLHNSSAAISRQAKIASGCLIDSNVSIASEAELGRFVTVYANSSVAHDSRIGDFVTLCPNVVVCGNVIIGEGSFIGANVVIKNEIKIGKNCTIGAGSVVVADIPDNTSVHGNPAVMHFKNHS